MCCTTGKPQIVCVCVCVCVCMQVSVSKLALESDTHAHTPWPWEELLLSDMDMAQLALLPDPAGAERTVNVSGNVTIGPNTAEVRG